MNGRMTLGLYNTYSSTFVEAHRRALARAAPIALAFEANLTTFGFPYKQELKTPREIAAWVADSTTIGEGGAYLIELANADRFVTFDVPKKGFPPQLGETVITTRKPEKEKAVSAEKLAALLDAGTSLCFVFGLGPRGLEKKLFNAGAYHFDVTHKGYSLETCTAIGAVPAAIHTCLNQRIKRNKS